MNKRGFILLDALVGVFIVCILSSITINVFFSYKNYKEGYANYKEDINERYEDIFRIQKGCERCLIEDEVDLSSLDQY